jgi:hypothetical protein
MKTLIIAMIIILSTLGSVYGLTVDEFGLLRVGDSVTSGNVTASVVEINRVSPAWVRVYHSGDDWFMATWKYETITSFTPRIDNSTADEVILLNSIIKQKDIEINVLKSKLEYITKSVSALLTDLTLLINRTLGELGEYQ